MKLSYISVEEAIILHILLMRRWREVYFGIDRKDLLESALNRRSWQQILKMPI